MLANLQVHDFVFLLKIICSEVFFLAVVLILENSLHRLKMARPSLGYCSQEMVFNH